MKVIVHDRFWRDVDQITTKSTKRQALDFIEEVQHSTFEDLHDVFYLKRLRGPAHTYRLAIDDYRVGIRYDQSRDVLIFMRFMHRESIYKFFP